MMKYHFLGPSGLRVSELCLGTMTFGEDWGWGASKDDSRAIFDEFVERGGNFIDTANGYTNGSSERMVGEFVAADRDRFVVATKYSFATVRGDPNSGGNHRKTMVQSLEGSLRRLGTDHVDLFWLHIWDFSTSIEEVMRGLDDLVRAGKVLYIGVSNTPAWIVSRANMLADLRGWSPFVALRGEYKSNIQSCHRSPSQRPWRSSAQGCSDWRPDEQSYREEFHGVAVSPKKGRSKRMFASRLFGIQLIPKE